MKPLIKVRDLAVRFHLKEGIVNAVNGVDLDIYPNRTLGIVGESGCGKSVTAKAILRILPTKAEITRGQILLSPRTEEVHPGDATREIDLAVPKSGSKQLRQIRGRDISMIFQEPMVSLSPVHTVGDQIGESLRLHQPELDKKQRKARVIENLRLVGIPMPESRFDQYPHELSGGLRQRVMIAMALACHPRLLIADEPTTALDVTIQAQILRLIERLQEELDMAVIMITHDLGVIAETADDVVVMYLGRAVEKASAQEVFHNPKHPYTQGLLKSLPQLGKGNTHRLAQIPGSVPDPFAELPGCPFHPRCPEAIAGKCNVGAPPDLLKVGQNHEVACVLYEDQAEPVGVGAGAQKDETDQDSGSTAGSGTGGTER